jgi:hypothetical protein
MSDIRNQKRLSRRVGHTEVIERPGASGQTTLYEEGTYTPTYTGGTTPGTTTYTLQDGVWVRVGNVIHVTGAVVWSAATGTGNARISLPFTPAHRGAGSLFVSGVTFAAGSPEIQIAGSAFFEMYSPASNAAGTVIAVEPAGEVRFTATLFV